MNFITPSVELLEINKPYSLDNIYKHIEYCGRTCYKSHDRITPDSAIKFVENMKKSGHGSVLEHGAIYLKCKTEFVDRHFCPENNDYQEVNDLYKYYDNAYSVVVEHDDSEKDIWLYVSTNLRVLVENNWLDDLKYLCEPTKFHEPRITFKFIADIGVTREFNRHRVNSPSEESTR